MTANCANDTCGKAFEMRRNRVKYCCEACRLEAFRKGKYTDADRERVAAMLAEGKTVRQVAVLENLTYAAMQKVISKWRAMGYTFANTRAVLCYEVGAIVYRDKDGYRNRAFEKMPDGSWKTLPLDDERNSHVERRGRITKPRVEKVPKAPKPKKEKPKLPDMPRKKREKTRRREDTRIASRVEDLSHKRRVYIPQLRAHVWVDASVTDVQAQQKYLDQRRYELTGR